MQARHQHLAKALHQSVGRRSRLLGGWRQPARGASSQFRQRWHHPTDTSLRDTARPRPTNGDGGRVAAGEKGLRCGSWAVTPELRERQARQPANQICKASGDQCSCKEEAKEAKRQAHGLFRTFNRRGVAPLPDGGAFDVGATLDRGSQDLGLVCRPSSRAGLSCPAVYVPAGSR